MAFKLPSLPQIVESFERWYVDFRIWWQQVTQKIEEQEDRQDETIALLNETVTRLDEAVDNIEEILTRLLDVEILADGTLAIVDQGLEADGTVKEGKVNTRSVQASAISGVEFGDGVDVNIPSDGSEVVCVTSPVFTVGDEIDGGALCEIMGQFDGTTNADSAADYYLETNTNGAGWVRRKTAKAGARTDGADTYSYQTVNAFYGERSAGLETIQVRSIAKAIPMPGSSEVASVMRAPAWRITPLRR